MTIRNLITCPDCGSLVSRLAEWCPICGRPIMQKQIVLELLALFVVGMIMSEVLTKVFVQRIGN
jgi:hypothetical protein